MQTQPEKSHRYKSQHGFTLVELLVVIAIISVLAAMLLPSMQQAMITARQIDCKNRMHQFMIVAHEYENDYRVFLPGFQTRPNGTNMYDGYTFMAALYFGGYISEEHALAPYNYSGVRVVNTILRYQSFTLCPAGIFRGLASRSTSGYDNCIGYGNNNGYGGVYFDDATFDILDGVARFAHPGFCFSYNINGGVAGYNLDYTRGFHINSSDSSDYRYYRPIKSFPQAASQKIYLIEGRHMRGYLGMWAMGIPQDFESACRHGDQTNYACYDGHIGAFGREVLEFSSINRGDIESAFDGELCF